MTPRPSLVPESDGYDAAKSAAIAQQAAATAAAAAAAEAAKQASSKAEPGKPPSRAGACRVCLKSFKPDDFSKTCYECQQRVCEDCASYSKLDETEDAVRGVKLIIVPIPSLTTDTFSNAANSTHGVAAFVAGKWHPACAYSKTPPIQCWRFQCWRHCNVATRMSNWAPAHS